jgi:hypothetical protein
MNQYNPTGLAQSTPHWSGSNVTTSEPQYHIPSMFNSTYNNEYDQLSQESYTCPHCQSKRPYFRLPHDTTNSMFCAKCRQPYHMCWVHQKIIAGLGHRADEKPQHLCQCIGSQSFLQQTDWNQPFQ